MTQIFAVDENNDLLLDSAGHLDIRTDLQAVLQMCEHVMKVLRGEIFLNTDVGVLGFGQDEVFGNSPNLIKFEFRGRAAMLKIEGVLEIVSFTAQLIDNVVVYTATIKTEFGIDTIGEDLT